MFLKITSQKKVPKILEKLKTELKLRGFTDKTVSTYIFQNKKFLDFTSKKPENTNEDDVKKYIAFLMSKEQKPSSVNLALSSLKFFYNEIMKKDLFKEIKPPKQEKKIPTVLTKEEIKNLINAAENPKHKLLIELMYSSGLRVSEAVSIKVNDLELDEKMGTIRSGKGKKDRHIILSENLIEHVKDYLNKRDDKNQYLFSVKDRHIGTRQAQKIVKQAALKAGIKKRVFCHAIRSSFATHLLDSGVDIRVIQELLGHSNLSTTERYTKVSREKLKQVKSPLDNIYS